jgi:hypothetical protein
VEFSTRSNGRELTQEDLDRWVASFPIEPMQTGIRHVALPADMQSPAEAARSEVP